MGECVVLGKQPCLGTPKYPLIISMPQREWKGQRVAWPLPSSRRIWSSLQERVRPCLEPAGSRWPHPVWLPPFNFLIKETIFHPDNQEAFFQGGRGLWVGPRRVGGADAQVGAALGSAPPRGAGVLASPLCSCVEPGPFGIGQEERLSLGGRVGGAALGWQVHPRQRFTPQ